MAFDKLEEGFENAMKEYNRKQIIQLNQLISNLLQEIPHLHRLLSNQLLTNQLLSNQHQFND